MTVRAEARGITVHFGIIAGEVTAFFLAENVIGFAAIAVCALVVSAGFMFKDHDTTFTPALEA